MAKTSVEIELLMRDSTRKGMQSAGNNIEDFQRMTEAAIKRLEGDLESMRSAFERATQAGSNQTENVAMIETLRKEVVLLKEELSALAKQGSETSSAPMVPVPEGLDLKGQIAEMKANIKYMEEYVKQYEKTLSSMAPGKEKMQMTQELNGAKQALDGERQALAALEQQMGSNGQRQLTLRTQIAQLKQEMSQMTEGTEEYRLAMERLGEMQDRYGDISTQGRIFSDDDKDIKATTDAISGLTGMMTAGAGVASLFGMEEEKLAVIQTKLQSVMAISMGIQQVANTLNKDSYFTHIILGKAKNLLARATDYETLSKSKNIIVTKLATAVQWAHNRAVAANPYVAAGIAILAVVAAIGALVYAYARWSSGTREAEKEQHRLSLEIERTKSAINQLSEDIDFDVRIAEAAGASKQELISLRKEAAKTALALADVNFDTINRKYTSGIATKEQLDEARELSNHAWENYLKVMQDAVVADIEKQHKNKKKEDANLVNEIADAQLSAQQKLEAARLAVMTDGYEKRKRLAQKELDETLADIDKSERDQLKKLDDAKKKGVTISPVQYTQVKDTAKGQRTEAARKYANDIWQIEKEGIEKQRKLSDVEKQSWIDYNKEYGTYQEKRLAIARDYVSKLSGVNTGGERATLKKEMEKQLEELDFDQFKGSIDFSKVFGSLDNLSTESLERLRDKLGKFIQEASKKFSPENTKELSDAFIRIDFKISERDPFRELKSSISEYKSAIRELEKAESDLAKVQSGQSVVATTRYDAATGKIVTTLLTQEDAERRLRTAEDKRAASLSKMNKSLHEGVDRAREYLDAATALTSALEDFGVSVPEEINGALDGFGQTLDSLASIDVTKPMSIVTGAIGAVGGLGKGILSLFGSAKELSQETIDQYNNYIGVIDDLIAKQQELIQSTAGSSAVVFSREAEEMIRKQMEASRQIGQDYFNSGASWRSSSHGVKQMDVIKRYRAELNSIGIDISRWGKRGTELFDLPARQLAELQKQLPKLWAQLDESTRTYLQAIIDGDEKLNEIMDQRNQSLTGITFDEARSSLKSLLLDADSTMADVADSFEDYMRQAIVNTIIDDTLRSQIKTWYEQFADAMDDGTLSGDEKKKLQELYQSIYQDAADMRDSVFDAAGISPETDKQSQSGRSGTVTALTEETGSELAGIGRNIQDHVVSLDKKFTAVSDTLFAVSGTLTKIEDNTRRSAEGIEEIVRDGLKMK